MGSRLMLQMDISALQAERHMDKGQLTNAIRCWFDVAQKAWAINWKWRVAYALDKINYLLEKGAKITLDSAGLQVSIAKAGVRIEDAALGLRIKITKGGLRMRDEDGRRVAFSPRKSRLKDPRLVELILPPPRLQGAVAASQRCTGRPHPGSRPCSVRPRGSTTAPSCLRPTP